MSEVFQVFAHRRLRPIRTLANNTMTFDDPVMQRARASAAMILTHFLRIIPVHIPRDLFIY